MKKITKIEFQKNNKDRLNIYIDDSFAFGVDVNIMIKHSLAKNMELSEDFIEEILKAEEEINVYNYALGILSRNAKSEKQLRTKLKEKGYDEQFIENAICKLKKQKYLNDELYSEMFISSKINVSKYGKRRIKQGLFEKGIDKEIIEEKLSLVSDEEELERAYFLGSKKLRTLKEEDTRKKSIKLSNYLINKGFEFSVIKKALHKLLNECVDELEEFEDY